MASQGPLPVGTGSDNATTGSISWSNPSNITADDTNFATATLFGDPAEHQIYLFFSGTKRGTNHATSSLLPASDSYVTYGSSSDLWGVAWTDTDINDVTWGCGLSVTDDIATRSHFLLATNFGFTLPTGAVPVGVVIEWKMSRSGNDALVNHCRATVYYTPALDPSTQLPAGAMQSVESAAAYVCRKPKWDVQAY